MRTHVHTNFHTNFCARAAAESRSQNSLLSAHSCLVSNLHSVTLANKTSPQMSDLQLPRGITPSEVDELAAAAASDEATLRRVLDSYHAIEKGRGFLTLADLPAALCLAGYSVSDSQLKPVVAELSAFDYTAYLRVVARVRALTNTPEAMIAAFKAFDKEGRGFITAHTFRNIFERMGLPSSRLHCDTVDNLLALADPTDSGRVEYSAVVGTVFSQHHALQHRRAVDKSSAAGTGKKGGGGSASAKKKA